MKQRELKMKKLLFSVMFCAALILCINGPAMAKLFIVEIDGDRIVVDYYVEEEQAWQETDPEEPGYWEGLDLRPYSDYGIKIWYPFLADTFDMTLNEQLQWIKKLRYARIKDWRIGYFWDTTPLKASLFGGLSLGTVNFSLIDTYVYFPPTACGPSRMEMISGFPYGCMTLGRTGNEEGAVTGALINAMDLGMDSGGPMPPNERYFTDGEMARLGGLFPFPLYYTLPRSEAQDHWMNFYMYGAPYDTQPYLIWYNDDLNYNRDDNTIGLMSPVDEVTGERPIGAWTVTEAVPEIWPPNHKFHLVTISDVVQPSGVLIPVTSVDVFQDEPVKGKGKGKGSGNTAPDARVEYTNEAAVVQIRAERDDKGDGRMYHISFSDGIGTYTFEVGIPKSQGKKHSLIDGGPIYNSMD